MIDTARPVIQDLIRRRKLDDARAADARLAATQSQSTVLDALGDGGFVSHRDLAISRARVAESLFVDLAQFEIEAANAGLLPARLARRLVAFPLFIIDGCVTVGMLDAADPYALDQIRQRTHLEVEAVFCEAPLLRALIARAYPPGPDAA